MKFRPVKPLAVVADLPTVSACVSPPCGVPASLAAPAPSPLGLVTLALQRTMIMIKNTEKYSYNQGKSQLNYSISTSRDGDCIVSMGKLFQSRIDLG